MERHKSSCQWPRVDKKALDTRHSSYDGSLKGGNERGTGNASDEASNRRIRKSAVPRILVNRYKAHDSDIFFSS